MKCWHWSGRLVGGIAEVQQTQVRDLAATADLPPHCARFSQQLLDLTCRWWTQTEDPDIDINDVHSLAAAVYIHIKLHSASAASPLLNRPSHGYRRSPRQVRASRRSDVTLTLDDPRSCHGRTSYPGISQLRARDTHTPAAWVQVFELRLTQQREQGFPQISSLRLSRVLPGVEPWPLSRSSSLTAHFSLESRPSRVGSSAWFLSCVFWICLQLAGVHLGKAAVALSVSSGECPPHVPRFCI